MKARTTKTKGGIDVPADLAAALTAEPEVLAMWQRLRPSCQREHVASVLDAKRPDTRQRRVAAVIEVTKEWNARHPRGAKSTGATTLRRASSGSTAWTMRG